MLIYDLAQELKLVKECNMSEGYYWIIVHGSELDKLNMIFEQECIEECMDFSQCAQIHYYRDYIFMVLNIIDMYKDKIISKELDIFLTKKCIVTVYKEEISVIEEMVKDIKKDRNWFILKQKSSPVIVLYYILDRIIVKNYNIISALEEKADKMELDILNSPNNEQINYLVKLRRQAYKLRKLLNPLRYIGDALITNENLIISRDNIIYLKNINNRISKLMAALDNLTQDLALVREAYESEIANKTNELMKAFTVITAIFLPLELITATFGMSFDCMPLKKYKFSFYMVLGVMSVLVGGLLYYFKRKKMF